MKKALYFIIVILLSACNSGSRSASESEQQGKETGGTNKIEYVTEHYPSGIKKVEGELVNGERHGKWIYYYENGFIWSEGKYRYGKRKGYSIVYYKNGGKKLVGQYKDDKKVGMWEVWNESGTLAHKISLDEPLTKEDSLRLKNQE